MKDTRPRRLAAAGTGLVAALAAGLLALSGTASAAPDPAPGVVAPPGPVTDFALAPTNGGGARGIAFTATWKPADARGGTALRYLVETRDDIGQNRTQTTTDTSASLFGDYCLAPFTVTVRAQTSDPAGRTLTGPPVSGRYGARNLCDITMSITAGPGTARGTIDVALHHEPPVDPFVAGPCALFVDGVQRWDGTCGGMQPDRTVTVSGLSSGRPYDVVLRTTTPRHVVLSSNHVVTDPS